MIHAKAQSVPQPLAPVLCAMEDAKYPNFGIFRNDLVHNQIRRSMNDPFAGASRIAAPAHVRKIDQVLTGCANFSDEAPRRRRVPLRKKIVDCLDL